MLFNLVSLTFGNRAVHPLETILCGIQFDPVHHKEYCGRYSPGSLVAVNEWMVAVM